MISKEKQREYSKKYRSENSEKIKEYRKNYSIENKEYFKNYYIENKEKNEEIKKEYFNKNKNKIYDKNKKYRENNKESVLDQKKNYYKDNKEKIKEYQKENKSKIKNYNKEYFKNNKDKLNEKRREYLKNKKSSDNLFKLKINIRIILYKSLKKMKYYKKNSTEEILGCTFDDFKSHIEGNFESWMNWSNYGKYNGKYEYGWDIDHIMELKNAETENDILKLNHYTNLRPLDSKINRVDRNYK